MDKTVEPAVRGNAFLIRGEKRIAIQVMGSNPLRQEGISPSQKRLVE